MNDRITSQPTHLWNTKVLPPDGVINTYVGNYMLSVRRIAVDSYATPYVAELRSMHTNYTIYKEHFKFLADARRSLTSKVTFIIDHERLHEMRK